MFEFCKTQIACLQALRQDRHAVTALEYGLIAAVMGTVLSAAFTAFGNDLKTLFDGLTTALSVAIT